MWKWNTVHVWKVALWEKCPGRSLGMGWQGQPLPCAVPAFSSQSSRILWRGFWCWDNPWAQLCISAALQQGQTSGQRKGEKSQDKLHTFLPGAGIIFILLEIQFHSHLDLPGVWCSSKTNGNLHCRTLHCETLLFKKLLTWRAVSLSLLLRLCSICERTEEEPALLSRVWVPLAVPHSLETPAGGHLLLGSFKECILLLTSCSATRVFKPTAPVS